MDWSIPGDEQENQRIQLEQEMMSRVAHLAFDNTSTHSTESSVEYPRHREPHDGPYSPHADAFPSFSMHEPDDLSQLVQDDNEHIEPNLRSFQHTADDSAMNTGETLSTAYHHASAITLGAGLGGGAFGRTPSRTGFSEFDPDRPLPNFPVKGGVKIALGEPTIMDQSTQHAKQTRQTVCSFSVYVLYVTDGRAFRPCRTLAVCLLWTQLLWKIQKSSNVLWSQVILIFHRASSPNKPTRAIRQQQTSAPPLIQRRNLLLAPNIVIPAALLVVALPAPSYPRPYRPVEMELSAQNAPELRLIFNDQL